MKLAYSESDVLASCLEFLKLRGIQAWRNNSGATLASHGDKRRLIRYGLKGSSDIIGILPGTGRWIAVETKRPARPEIGQRGGTLRRPQREFLEMIARDGGVGICVSDVGQLESVVATLEAFPATRFDIKGDVLTAPRTEEQR